MALTIDNLEIKIEAEAQKATSGIDALAVSLTKLRDAVGGSSGLASNLTQIANALHTFSGVGKINMTSKINQINKLQELIPTLGGAGGTQLANNLREIAGALTAFSAVPKTNVNVGSIAKAINELNTATSSFDAARLSQFSAQMRGIAEGLSQLNGVGKNGVSSTVNALKKIPEITATLDPATLDAFAQKMQRLTEIMGPLASQMDGVARGFNALPRSIKRAVSASNQATTSNKKLSLSFNDLMTQLARTAAKYMTLYYAVSRVADIFADWFNESNEYIENLNLFKVSMGDAADEALDFAESVSKAMGIDPSEWMQNQGVFQRMATGFGISADQANVMSKNLTQLAYDLSSFFNTDLQTSMQKLQSGMSGQIKGLKAWGYNLSVAALQETALSLGIEQSVRTMTEAQKAQLRYITLIQKSNGIMGDMAKTINTPANSMRILTAQITQLKRALGNIVSVLVTKYIPYIMAFVEMIEEAATALAEAWGFEIPELPANNLEMGSEVIEGIGNDAEDTGDALSELKKQLAGFDELNILKSDTSNDPSYDLGFEMPDYDFLSGLKNIDLEPYKEKLRDILDLVIAIGAGFAAWKIGDALFTGLKNMSDILGSLSKGDLITGGWIAAIIAGVPLLVSGLYDAIKNEIDAKDAILIPVGTTLIGAGIGGLIGGPAGAGIGALVGLGIGAITDFTIFFWQKFDEIEQWFVDLPGVVKTALTAIVALNTNTNPFVGLLVSIGGVITAIKKWDEIVAWVDTNVVQPLENTFGPAVEWFGDLFEGCGLIIRAAFKVTFDYLKEKWTNFSTWMNENIISPVVEAWDKATAKIEEVFDKLWNAIKAGVAPPLNAVIGGIESVLNYAIRGINKLVGGFNKVANWAAGVLGENWGGLSLINEVKFERISAYETGGFPSMGEFFVARERGPELVGRIGNKSAVANNDQIISGIASAVYSAMMAAHEDSDDGNGGNARIVVQIGEQAVGEASVRYINGRIRQTGRNPIYT